jgi:putative colanic acid biosynthesis acetyltransferase WcaF
MNLASYSAAHFDRGASMGKEALWWLARALFFLTPFPWPSGLRVALLRAFGARIGEGVVIREGVNISFPWRLTLGNHVWLGEEVMILSLAPVVIGSNVCVSQRAFLCSGSHDFQAETFNLITKPITVGDGCWIAAAAFIAAGVEIGAGSVVSAGSVVIGNVPPRTLVRGNPAEVLRELS